MSDRVLRFKDSETPFLKGLQPEMLVCIDISLRAFHNNGLPMTITSARSGKHSNHSHHFKGLAIDIRTWDLTGLAGNPSVEQMCSQLRNSLGSKYQVIQESDHIHIEFDPVGL